MEAIDLIHIGFILLTCYACKCWGYQRGIGDTLEFFESKGIIEMEKDPK
jgi:hypothetical protein